MKNEKAVIWLQDGEEIGAADCGCCLVNDAEGARFFMCATHEAALDLNNALIKAEQCLSHGSLIWKQARAAITKASGKLSS